MIAYDNQSGAEAVKTSYEGSRAKSVSLIFEIHSALESS